MKRIIITNASTRPSQARFIINRMKNIQQVLKESPASSYTGSSQTFDMVSNQIKARWGETELKNYDPFHNTRTFRSWLSLGFRVKKGEKALRSITFVEEKDEQGNIIKRIPRAVFLFYYKQVELIAK